MFMSLPESPFVLLRTVMAMLTEPVRGKEPYYS